MIGDSNPLTHLPPEQQAIRAKCFHPTDTFVEFKREEIEQSIPERFEKIVRLYPDRIAVKAKNTTFTYDELNQAANRVARAILTTRGIGSEPIALLFEHGIEVVAVILGILKAGKFYVALDPSFPGQRITHLLQDSGTALIVTNRPTLDLVGNFASGCSTLSLEEINHSLSYENLNLSSAPDDPAHLIYTSGSTGTPKGVIHSHRTYLHRAMQYTNEIRICADDRLSLLHSVSFGSSRLNLFQAPLSGASLFPFDVKSQGTHRLAAWLKEERITICHLSPAVFRQLADLVSGPEDLPSLRLIHLSGAPITQQDYDFYKKTFPPRTALRIYMGTTETVEVCSYIVNPDLSYPKDGVPVGYPVIGKKVFLLNENGHEAEPGQIGEVAVKSRYLAAGYWRRSELTKAKFLPDPDGGEERIYLTGDLGRKLPDGFVIHLGRKDGTVNIRGYSVELAEIEAALLEHAAVKEAAVVGRETQSGDKQLVAYFVPAEMPATSVTELRNLLKERLPDYMIPSAFVVLRALPLTPNGKVDRLALPAPESKRPEIDTPFSTPRSPIEEELAEIWAEVLSLDRVGIHDNFFDLGGHSLAATRVISQVIRKFQLELPLQSLFQSPTIAAMAALITEHQGKQLGEEELDCVLTELESLSNEEAKRFLADQRASVHTKGSHG